MVFWRIAKSEVSSGDKPKRGKRGIRMNAPLTEELNESESKVFKK